MELQKKEQALQEEKQRIDNERNQVQAAKLQLEGQEQQLSHQREMLKIEEKREERLDKAMLENEKLRNEVSGLKVKLDIADADRRLDGAKTAAEIEKIGADAMKARAETAKTMEETEGLSIENAAAESGVNNMLDELGAEEET